MIPRVFWGFFLPKKPIPCSDREQKRALQYYCMETDFMRITLALFVLSLVSFQSLAQTPWCGSHHEHERLEGHTETEAQFERFYQERLSREYGAVSKRETKYTIPVVFHVIHENGPENVSLEDLQGLIDIVNDDLAATNKDTALIQAPFKGMQADCGIELVMAKKDPDGNCTNGVTRTFSSETNDAYQNVKSIIRWPNQHYLNVWVVKSITSPWGQDDGSIILGFAQFPGGNASRDGIVMRSDRMTGNTLTHELGHYLNLYHTFQSGCGFNCTNSGDRICDTPPSAEANYGCPKGRNSCSNDSPDQIDMITNHMDYANCSGIFTEGQRIRMQSAIDVYRSELVSEDNLARTGTDGKEVVTTPIADFYADKFKVCAGESISFNNSSCNHVGNSTFSWSFKGAEELASSDEFPSITFNEPGKYDVTLTITNSEGSDTKTITDFIEIGSLESELASPYTHSFNSLSNLPWNWDFESEPDNFSWQLREGNGFGASKSFYLNNYVNIQEGAEASFILPPLDLSTNEDKALRYKVSYARTSDASSDLLQVSVSIDCGQTWRLVQSDVSSRLMTTSNQSSSFFPTEDAQWAEKELDLSRYGSFKNIEIKFTFIAGDGNNIFIDDIRMGSAELSTPEIAHSINANIFPNPTDGLLHIHLPQYSTAHTAQLFDLTGKTVWSETINSTTTQLNLEGTEQGVYQLVLLGDGVKSVYKIVIQ